ncbi:unnamed protein product, partial [Didymodactylos carnosus]
MKAIEDYEEISYLPDYPLDKIRMDEVIQQWKKFKCKRAIDSAGTAALLFKNLPTEYLNVITVLFDKCAKKGLCLKESKYAKVICLSKDGLYPKENRLRPISLLPNLGKWMERIVHDRLIKWCDAKGIHVDEQSGFTPERRLQTRIISMCDDLRLTITAPNRPALILFVDFMSAFDRVWYPALIHNLKELGLPSQLLRWIYNWLQDRSMSVYFGDAVSRKVKISVGAPQGSILAATLFRLHVYFLPKYFAQFTMHLFADDLAIIIYGALEKRFSDNTIQLEMQAKIALEILEKFADNMILPVNVSKTKAMLVHNVVAPQLPVVEYKRIVIEFVLIFKYLGIEIRAKLGWGIYIQNRVAIIRNVYAALQPGRRRAKEHQHHIKISLNEYNYLKSIGIRSQHTSQMAFFTNLKIVENLVFGKYKDK